MTKEPTTRFDCPVCSYPIDLTQDRFVSHFRLHASAVPNKNALDVCFHLLAVASGETELWPELAKRRDDPRRELTDLSRGKPVLGQEQVSKSKGSSGRVTYGTPHKRRP
jgi:hypothetical protein